MNTYTHDKSKRKALFVFATKNTDESTKCKTLERSDRNTVSRQNKEQHGLATQEAATLARKRTPTKLSDTNGNN